MIRKTHGGRGRSALRRMAALALSLTLLIGTLPLLPRPEAEAAEWMRPYLDQMVEWGVMQGDANGNLNEDRQITRAEFVTLVNRAFGYTEMGDNPFSDVPDSAWYSEDIRIAYQAGYFNGTSPTTASPNALVTREQAAALIGRNLRLQGGTGTITSFTDNREIGVWSRGLVQEAANLGIIQGYEDGTFRPQNYITRGQVACFLSRALGTLVKDPGEVTSGGVYGNLTVTSPGVTLRDTVITGNLYLTGGVGLGNVVLENVDVLGKIVVCGAGESQEGDNSVVLRNVTAGGMEIDSLTDQFMTVRSEGLTTIDNTTVRTSAYLEDLTDNGLGLKYIELNGADGTQLHLAGNIKEVMNLTPGSSILVAQGVTNKLTMDERAVDAALSIDTSALIRELNLDRATPVTGAGSIDVLNVNADGSIVSVLPDQIAVRPGVTANIYGQNMDTTLAAESSDEPRLLAGYPYTKNVASTSADAVFSTNKQGTIRWAVTALTDGSVGEEELMNPGEYSAKILRNGTINATASKTEFTTRLTGLTVSGGYYISAMLVDNRNHRSPVKVAAFTTTDDSAPNFATGYPTTILAEEKNGTQIDQIIQAMVMPTKSCQLYYALLPKGSTAPTGNALKSAAVTGNLGYGMVEVKKNTPYLIPKVNSSYLAEQTQYDLYLWLNDADSGKSSAVKKITVTTLDKTPPVVTNLYQSNSAATTATVTYSINEAATLYWAVVPAGDTFLRPTAAGEEIKPTDLAAKIQVEAGTYATKKGSSNAARADTNYTFTVTGLTPQMSYDLYYVAKDRAGNYSEEVLVFSGLKTLDNAAPTVTQEFSLVQEDSSGMEHPLTETDVTLAFSEIVWGTYTSGNQKLHDDFEALYSRVQEHEGDEDPAMLNQAKAALGETLSKYITFYTVANNGRKEEAVQRASLTDQSSTAWDIDFREVTISRAEGKMSITFPSGRGVNLRSGGTYQFQLKSISDTSGNVMNVTQLPQFRTIFATVDLAVGDTVRIDTYEVDDVSGLDVTDDGYLRVDMNFTMYPRSTRQVPDDTVWDLLLWTDTTMSYTLFGRPVGSSEWSRLGDVNANVASAASEGGKVYASLSRFIQHNDLFDPLNQLVDEWEYAVHVNSINDDTNYTAWNRNVTMGVTVIAGGNYSVGLAGLGSSLGFRSHLTSAVNAGAVSIGQPDPFEVMIPFTDSTAPEFINNTPDMDAGDVMVNIRVMLDRPGTVYYVVSPLREGADGFPDVSSSALVTRDTNGNIPALSSIPASGDASEPSEGLLKLQLPLVSEVTGGNQNISGVFSGNTGQISANLTHTITLRGLRDETTYLVYLATSGISPVYSTNVMCYQFTTGTVEAPKLEMRSSGSSNAQVRTDLDSEVRGLLTVDGNIPFLRQEFSVAAGTAKDDNFNKGSGSGPKGEYLIVDALMNSEGTGSSISVRNSVFDLHARPDVIEELYQLIISSSIAPGSIVDIVNSFAVTGVTNGGNWQEVKLNGMEEGTWYCLLAYAESPLGSERSFRAVRPLELADTEGPKVQGTAVVFDKDDKGNDIAYFTMTFTEPLWFQTQDGMQDIKQVSPTSMTSCIGTDYVSIDSGAICTASYPYWQTYIDPATAPKATNQLVFSTPGRVPIPGEYIFQINRGLCDKWGNPKGTNSSFQVKVNISKEVDENGRESFNYTVTGIPREWDARVN